VSYARAALASADAQRGWLVPEQSRAFLALESAGETVDILVIE